MARPGFSKLNPLGYAQITGISSAVLVPNVPAGTVAFSLQANGASIRWRADGTNPTATVGMLVHNNMAAEFYRFAPTQLRVIETTPTGNVNITFYGE